MGGESSKPESKPVRRDLSDQAFQRRQQQAYDDYVANLHRQNQSLYPKLHQDINNLVQTRSNISPSAPPAPSHLVLNPTTTSRQSSAKTSTATNTPTSNAGSRVAHATSANAFETMSYASTSTASPNNQQPLASSNTPVSAFSEIKPHTSTTPMSRQTATPVFAGNTARPLTPSSSITSTAPLPAMPTTKTPSSAFNAPNSTGNTVYAAKETRRQPKQWNNRGNVWKSSTCSTCKSPFTVDIFQCENGHSSCEDCQIKKIPCGYCQRPISENIRNFALQDYIAELITPCKYQSDGCTLHFKQSEMKSHYKECPFGDMDCPVKAIGKQCSWKGKQSDLSAHFKTVHPYIEISSAARESNLPNIKFDNNKMSLIELGFFKFLVYVQVNLTDRSVYLTVLLLGTEVSATKWSYELHIYNKREPRRKFTFYNVCRGMATSVDNIFEEKNCAVLALPLAKTFVNDLANVISYKVFIKRTTPVNGDDS